MFTGIITDIGEIVAVENKEQDKSFQIKTGFDMEGVDIGASISCSGACMTVIEKGDDWFKVDVSAESISRTNLGKWQEGTKINLERSLKAGDEMGGHNVTGHVDGLAEVKSIEQVDECWKFEFIATHNIMEYIAEKGSVTLNGVSLTVNEVTDHSFNVNIIPHTFENTVFQYLKEGDEVNLEIDVIARYTARLLENR
jgi:riboflavin synthase